MRGARTLTRPALAASLAALSMGSAACTWRGPTLRGPIGIVGLIHLAIQIWAIVEIVQSNKATLHKVLWILLVLMVPVVGIILWFLLGR